VRFELLIAARYCCEPNADRLSSASSRHLRRRSRRWSRLAYHRTRNHQRLRRDLQERLLGSTAHVQLMRIAADGIRDWRTLTDRLRKLPTSPRRLPVFNEQVLISNGAFALAEASSKGIVPKDGGTVSDLLHPSTRLCRCTRTIVLQPHQHPSGELLSLSERSRREHRSSRRNTVLVISRKES